MKYENMCKGNFIARPNRFIAEVSLGGETVRAHVKNTGRFTWKTLQDAWGAVKCDTL